MSNKKKNRDNKKYVQKAIQVTNPVLQSVLAATGSGPKETLNIAVWGATPYVITGFGIVMKELLKGLYKTFPGVYNIFQTAINFHGDFFEENEITGGPQNGRFRQWPAKVLFPNGQINLYGQTKFLEMLKTLQDVDLDAVFLFEDPFCVGGGTPGAQQEVAFLQAVKQELARQGKGIVPVVAYFPIDGIPKPQWIDTISKFVEIPITYLPFAHQSCVKVNPQIGQRLRVIPHGVNTKDFFPIPQNELRAFKRAMFGDASVDKFMLLNVNRNQIRKLIPANLIAFKEFKKIVPDSFIYLNMQPVDVGWNLIEVCNSLDLKIGVDVFFPPDFNVQKGLSVSDLNKVFNCADVLTSTATGGGWELSVSQAFATKTSVLMPNNTSHTDLCGDQSDIQKQRGLLYNSGSKLAQITIFPGDNEVPRPLPDLDDMVSKLVFMHQNPAFCRKIEDNAFSWAHSALSWEKNIVPQFHKAFLDAKSIKQSRLNQIQQQQAPVAAPVEAPKTGALQKALEALKEKAQPDAS